MTEWILNNLVLTGAGATAVLFILARLIPSSKLFAWGEALGMAVTAGGRRLVGEVFWEKIECAVLDWGGFFVLGIQSGLKSDNTKKENKQ